MADHPDRTASGEAGTRLIRQTFPLQGLLGAVGDELMAPLGLASARWKVFSAIERSDKPLHVSQIARNMGLTRQAVQRIVNELVEEGFLALSNNPDHERARHVRSTRRGRKVFEARIKRVGVVNAWDDSAFANACRATGKRNFVMAGVTTDVCMVAPAISAPLLSLAFRDRSPGSKPT